MPTSEHEPESPYPIHPPRAARWGPWRLNPPSGIRARKLKVLLLHGFCASPRELRPLGLSLRKDGFRCLAPLLPGHGEQFAGMRSCLVEDWLEAVKLTFEALRRDGSPIAVVGYCLGGTLGLLTAAEFGPRGLVAAASPVGELKAGLFPPAESPDLIETRLWIEDCLSLKALHWRRIASHPLTTPNFVENFQQVARDAEAGLDQIRCPVLAVEAAQSQVLPPGHGEQLLARMTGCQSKSLFRVDESRHALLLDRGRAVVRTKILNFLRDLDQAESHLSF